MSGFPSVPPVQSESLFAAWLRKVAQCFWTIPEYTADPVAPTPGDVWILFSGGNYQLSFRTKAGTTKRVTLT
jgi:hypothetical protein